MAFNRLESRLRAHLALLAERGICLAFSGGVDSTLLLALLRDAPNVIAVTFVSELQPPQDLTLTCELANHYNVPHHVLTVNLLEDETLRNNPLDRCYRCKHALFSELKAFAQANNLGIVMDGTNSDDLCLHRPGRRALQELAIASPLAELGITKAQVRTLATHLAVPVAERPSSPCLATRLPYHTLITPERLALIDRAETILSTFGFATVRFRLHGEVGRIEVPIADLLSLIAHRKAILTQLKPLGITYLTLDIEGFRSGSMDTPNHNMD